jgi:outer membrane protein
MSLQISGLDLGKAAGSWSSTMVSRTFSALKYRSVSGLATVLSAVALLSVPATVSAQTLEQAIGKAYVNNPTLNAQRAALRATNEGVPQAKAGYRPVIVGSADAGLTSANARTGPTLLGPGGRAGVDNRPRGVGLSLQQPLFDGFRTPNAVKAAKANILAGRAELQNVEQNILYEAVEAYMNVLRDFAIFDLQRNNVRLLGEEFRATSERFKVGEVTRTDVAQSESRQALSRAQLSVAEANLKASRAAYRRVIGEDPKTLHAGRPVDKLLPRTLDAALKQGYEQHPAIIAAFHVVDAATLQVKVIEGELYPNLAVEAGVSARWDDSEQTRQSNAASVVGRLTVPIYQAGQVSSRVRQAKEQLGQARLEAEVLRDQVRAAIVSSWGLLEGARSQIEAAQAQVMASQSALNGVREEARVGQRTILDSLNAQQELLDARVSLITAQRDRVVASYAVLQAIGRLSAPALNRNVNRYNEVEHYQQVKDKWAGLRTPDGR